MKRFWQHIITLAAVMACDPLFSAPIPWSVEIDRITRGTTSAEQLLIRNHSDGSSSDQVDVSALRIVIEEQDIQPGPFRLSCPGSLVTVVSRTCVGGSWSINVSGELPALSGTVVDASFAESQASLRTEGFADDIAWEADLESSEDGFALHAKFPKQPFEKIAALVSNVPEFGWVSAGDFEGTVEVTMLEGRDTWIRSETEFTGIEFDSPDGLYAGLGISLNLSLGIGNLDTEPVALNAQISSGELLLMDFYRNYAESTLDVAAFLEWRGPLIEISRFVVNDGSILAIAGEATIPIPSEPGGEGQEMELILREFSLVFPHAYTAYLEPVATVYSLDGLDTQGSVSWTGDWEPGSARNGTLNINQFSVEDSQGGRFGIRNLTGELSTNSESIFTWDTLSFEKIDLGAGSATLALAPESVRLTEPLTIGVFGGTFNVEQFSVTLPKSGEPDIQLRASIDGIEMQQMSTAIGWPEFGGTLSGTIPGINWSDGVIEVEGALDFKVFDGQLLLTDLRVERPFGVLPSLAANITATGLDLEELTQTFEFGRIAGRADGYIRDLRMLDWQPVQFDAWFGTPLSDNKKHDISRQAVSHLTTLGGGSPTTMLTGPVLRLFSNFSYRRLGFGCELRNNVCQIRGVDEQNEGVLLMEGAGIPKISILAYNRSVDWPQMVSELSALTGGGSIRIGD